MDLGGFSRVLFGLCWIAPFAFMYQRLFWLTFHCNTTSTHSETPLARLRSGDIVFLGSFKHVSQQLAGWSKSRYTHCGIVVRMPNGKLGMFQADPNEHKTKCLLCGSAEGGVHVFELEPYLDGADSVRVYRPPSPIMSRSQLIAKAKWYCTRGIEFTFDPLLLLSSVFGWNFGFSRPTSRFCSQLVCEAYHLPFDPACCTPGMLLDHVVQNQWERV